MMPYLRRWKFIPLAFLLFAVAVWISPKSGADLLDTDREWEIETVQEYFTAEERAVNAIFRGDVDFALLADFWHEDVVVVGDHAEYHGLDEVPAGFTLAATNVATLTGVFPFEIFHTITNVNFTGQEIYCRAVLYIVKPGTETTPGVAPDVDDVLDRLNCFIELSRVNGRRSGNSNPTRYLVTAIQISSTPDYPTSAVWGTTVIE